MAWKALLAAASGLFWTASAMAVDWNGYASVGTDYVYRGISLIDSGPALQGGIEGRIEDHVIAGATAARVDRQWTYLQEVPDHLQLDVYAGADFSCGSHCRTRLLVSRYLFPGPNAHDWTEVTAAASLFDRFGGSFSWSPRGLGSNEVTRTFEAWWQQPLSRSTSVEVGYGKVLIEDLDYWYARAGVSRRFGRFIVDLSTHWSDHGLRRFAFDERNRHWVLTATTGF